MADSLKLDQISESDVSKRLMQDIERQLPIALRTEEFSAYKDFDSEFLEKLRARLGIARQDFDTDVNAIIVNEHAQQDSTQREKRQRTYLNIVAAVLTIVTLYFMVTIPLQYNKVYSGTPHIRTLVSVVLVEILASFFIIIIWLTAAGVARVLPSVQISTALSSDHYRLTRRYEAALQIFVTEQMRLIIPAFPEAVAKVAFLQYSSALVELALSEPISTKALKEIEQFVTSHRASALGLAGPRGIGKSTILRYLTSMENTLGVYIPAPVRYEPNELLARMFEGLAIAYLSASWRRSIIAYRRLFTPFTLLATLYGVLALLFGGGALVYFGPTIPKMNSARWLGVLLFLGGIAILFYLGLGYVRARRNRLSPSREDSPVARAQNVLEDLRWQSQRTSSSTIEAKPWGGLLKFSSDTSATATKRDIGRPRLVADFQDFIRLISMQHGSTRIIIAVDELDKLASVDDLIAVINEIKDVLHVEGTHVIVSVSREALARFLLRGLPYRDVFDSTFDEIMEVPALSPAEAVEVLKKRAIGFPVNWGLACYILSAGLPRDLLRFGRRCVAIYRENNVTRNDVPMWLVGELTQEKVKAELQASGKLARLTHRGRTDLDSALQAAAKGSIAEIEKFVNEVYSSPQSPISRWLGWLTEVMKFLKTDVSHDLSDVSDAIATSAESLAKSGVLATVEGGS